MWHVFIQLNSRFFDVLLTAHLGIFFSVINQLVAQKFCFTVSLFHASTCFEHMCSSSGSQNCITQPLVSSHLQFWLPDDEHMCWKHVEAWNNLIVKQKFFASSWLITEVSKFKMFPDWNQRQNERRQRIKFFFWGLILDSTSGSRPSHCRGFYITPWHTTFSWNSLDE